MVRILERISFGSDSHTVVCVCVWPDKMSAFVRPNLQKPNAKWMGKAELIWSGVYNVPTQHITFVFFGCFFYFIFID